MSERMLPKKDHSASESDQLERLKSQHKALLEDAQERGAKWFNHREEYAKLDKVLERLPEDTSTEAIVPLTKKAFMLGHLVHQLFKIYRSRPRCSVTTAEGKATRN